MAFTLGETTFELLDDTGMVVDSTTVELKVAPQIAWTFRNVAEQVNAKGRLSIAMEVRNDGNAVDGLIVQLQSSHSVDMGFIPPDIAVYEEGVEFPRSFEVNDIPLNSNFTIRAWVQLPQDQTSNGTVYINTTIRSRFAPELPFVHTSTGDYLGVAWQPSEAVEEGIDWGGMAATAVLYVKAWAGVVFSVLLASIILYKAVIDRRSRLEESRVLPYQKSAEQPEDWMGQYQKEADATSTVAPSSSPLKRSPKQRTKPCFATNTACRKQPDRRLTPNWSLLPAWSSTRGRKRRTRTKADQLPGSLQSQGASVPLPANPALAQEPASPAPPLSNDGANSPPVDDLEF